MDTRLKSALELANAVETLTNQRKLALSKYKQTQVLFYNGGTFSADLNLLSAVGMLQLHVPDEGLVLVDSNNIPIKIVDVDEFLFLVRSRVIESARQYYNEYEELKKVRTPQAVLDK